MSRRASARLLTGLTVALVLWGCAAAPDCDRITGVQRPEGLSRFFHNGNLRGEVRDAEFTRRFFGIWLGESTSEPSLRDSLLGRR